MEIETQRLRDGADDIEEIESGHDGRFYGAKIANLEKQNKNARQHLPGGMFSVQIHHEFMTTFIIKLLIPWRRQFSIARSTCVYID